MPQHGDRRWETGDGGAVALERGRLEGWNVLSPLVGSQLVKSSNGQLV